MFNIDSKHIIYFSLLIFSTIVFNFSCHKSKTNNSGPEGYLIEFLEDSIFGSGVKLLPAKDHQEIFRYYQTSGWGGDYIILTIDRISNGYKIQLISGILDVDGIFKKNIYEKKVSLARFNEIEKIILKNKETNINLDPNNSGIDGPYFSLLFKKDDRVLGFYGVPSIYNMDKNKKDILNKNKQEILKVVCQLINETYKIEKIKYIEESGFNKTKDSISYSVSLLFTYFSSDIEVFLDEHPINLDNNSEIMLSVHDTFDLKNRIKIIETEWDGTINEY